MDNRMWRELGEDIPDREPRFTKSGVLLEEPGDEARIFDVEDAACKNCKTCASWRAFADPEGPIWIGTNKNHSRDKEDFMAGPDSISEIRRLLSEWGGCVYLHAVTHESDICDGYRTQRVIEDVLHSRDDRQFLKDMQAELQALARQMWTAKDSSTVFSGIHELIQKIRAELNDDG